MSKRLFRRTPRDEKQEARYPTLDEFDRSRRDFLARLGASVLGASLLGPALAGCGERPVGGGNPSPPDSGRKKPDSRPKPQPDVEVSPGAAPAPDARVDRGPDGHMDGDPAQPDARIDEYLDGGMGGAPRLPDARIDNPAPTPGYAPFPDAGPPRK